MDYKGHEVKAGIFIFVAIVLTIVFLMIIVGASRFEDKVSFRAQFSYVGGIEPGSMVRYAGVQVGQVTEVKLAGKNYPGAEVVFEVREDTPVKTDSEAYLTTVGIMGSYYVEISVGSTDAPLLPPGSLIPSKDITGYAQMSGKASEMLHEITELIDGMNAMFNPQNRKKISKALSAASDIVVTTEMNLDTTLQSVHTLTVHMEKMLANMDRMIAQNESTLTQSVQNLEQLLRSSQETVEHVNTLLQGVDKSLISNKAQLQQIVENLNSITNNLNEFSRQLKERPWSAVRKTHPPQRELP